MKKIAFSLVELMVTLVVLSVIVSALAPIITKKLKNNAIQIQNSTITKGGSENNDEETKEEEIDCKTYDVNCSECNKTSCTKCTLGYELKDGKCDTFCKGDNLTIIGNLCVTTCNMGDCGLPLSYTSGTCWKPTGGTCVDIDSSYSGCNRTLCNYEAGVQACNTYIEGKIGWRLPTLYDVQDWDTENNNLRLCDELNGYNNTSCPTIIGGCTGSWSNNCVASLFWIAGEYSDTRKMYGGIRKNSFVIGNDFNFYAFSVRCVYDLK